MIPDISLVSGTYRRLPMLKKMVESARRSIAAGLTYEIILVTAQDDAETIAWCKAQPDVRLIVQSGLHGAIAAFNEGFAAARGRYVVSGNDDLTWAGGSVTAALAFMGTHPEVGIGLFMTDRFRSISVDTMPAISEDGQFTSVPYGGISIFPNWLGRRLQYWSLPGARTYGGDCAFCARALEAGWKVEPIPGTLVNETIPNDELNRRNSGIPENQNGKHPDSEAYLRVYPHGPRIYSRRLFEAPPDARAPLRILYAPIFEASLVQHQQKWGLRRALQKTGSVVEVDYIQKGPQKILEAAAIWKPHLVLLQIHNPDPFGLAHMTQLRRLLPNATIANWNGDKYDLDDNAQQAGEYVQMLRLCDLHTGVNQTSLDGLAAHGVHTAYWQIGYEPEGVGHEPQPDQPEYDVLLLGNGYSANRRRLGDFLQTLTCRMAVFGSGWEGLAAQPSTLYDFRAGCRLYRSARLALGDSEWAATARGFVSNRVFQAMAAGYCLMLQQWFAGNELLGLEDGKHWVLWRDFEDLREKIDYFLGHETERRRIANAGHVEVLRYHSFEKRVQELLALLRQPKPPALDRSQGQAEPPNGDPTLAVFHQKLKETRA